MVVDITKYDIHDGEDCINLLASFGFDKFDLEAIVESLSDYKVRGKAAQGGIEGLIGDDLYVMQENCLSCVDDLKDEIENLRGTSRKNNTKADIANRLSSIAWNLTTYLNSCRVYEYADL